MLVTPDAALAEKCASIRHQGQRARYDHIYLGYNYRMTELQAAIGIVQLDRFPALLAEKSAFAKRYDEKLKNIPGLSLPWVPPYVDQPAWYMYTVSVASKEIRDRLVAGLAERNIETRLSFPPVHAQPYYRERFGTTEKSLPVTWDTWSRLINIPLWAGMGEERQDFVIRSLKELFGA